LIQINLTLLALLRFGAFSLVEPADRRLRKSVVSIGKAGRCTPSGVIGKRHARPPSEGNRGNSDRTAPRLAVSRSSRVSRGGTQRRPQPRGPALTGRCRTSTPSNTEGDEFVTARRGDNGPMGEPGGYTLSRMEAKMHKNEQRCFSLHRRQKLAVANVRNRLRRQSAISSSRASCPPTWPDRPHH
jgi:hypothetical protein